jgi:hypothetical protein
MTNERLKTLLQEAHWREEKILNTKGKDYAKEGDRLSNFKAVAELLSGAPMDSYTVGAVYFLKHVISIMNHVRTRRLESEPIEMRFADSRNYILLLQALNEETDTSERLKEAPTEEDLNEAAEALVGKDPIGRQLVNKLFGRGDEQKAEGEGREEPVGA